MPISDVVTSDVGTSSSASASAAALTKGLAAATVDSLSFLGDNAGFLASPASLEEAIRG